MQLILFTIIHPHHKYRANLPADLVDIIIRFRVSTDNGVLTPFICEPVVPIKTYVESILLSCAKHETQKHTNRKQQNPDWSLSESRESLDYSKASVEHLIVFSPHYCLPIGQSSFL
jgi:hypothetical protein